jgi:hypothetical protein
MDSTKSNDLSNKLKNITKNTSTLNQIKSLIPMLSIKNIIVGSIGTVIPWIILLFICTIIIII